MDPADNGLRTTLVDAALDLLETGTGDLSLRAVARAAGVSAMAPYRHFADKAALLGAAAERGYALLRERLLEADAAGSPREALIAQGLAYIAFACARPALFRLMFAGPAEATLDAACKASGFTVLSQRVAGMVNDAAAAEAATLACWGLVHGLATLALDGRQPRDAAGDEAALRILVAGIVQ